MSMTPYLEYKMMGLKHYNYIINTFEYLFLYCSIYNKYYREKKDLS